MRAGLELVSAVGALKTHAPLQTRVGIATGLVIVGVIGSGAAQEQAIVGEAPNQPVRTCLNMIVMAPYPGAQQQRPHCIFHREARGMCSAMANDSGILSQGAQEARYLDHPCNDVEANQKGSERSRPARVEHPGQSDDTITVMPRTSFTTIWAADNSAHLIS